MGKITLSHQCSKFKNFQEDSQIEPIYRCIDWNVDRITIQQVNREVFNPVYRCKRDYTTHINERVNTAIYE